jgi:hypothetical protein
MDQAENTFSFYCCAFVGAMCLPARYLAMAALLLLDAGWLENVYLFVPQQWPNLSQYIYIYIAPKGYHEQIHVSHLLGCHATLHDNKNVWLLSENGYCFRMCDILMGTLLCAEAGIRTPCNCCTCVRQFCLIWMHVSMISCFLMELNDCHTRIPWLNWLQFFFAVCWFLCLVMIRWKSKEPINITIQRLFCWQTPKEHSFTGYCMQQWRSGSRLIGTAKV